MPIKDKSKKSEYDKSMLQLGIRLSPTDENTALVNALKQAAIDAGIKPTKYAIQAIKEKLERDGYI